jgi:magnesium transporter
MDGDAAADSFVMGPLPQGQHTIPDNHEDSLQHPDTHAGSDIYRGSSLQYRVPEVDRVSSSISPSTTSASTHLVRRAIATLVELAILRWARSSSSTSSDSSFSYAHNGATRRQTSRQRHPNRPSIYTADADTTYIARAREVAERARHVPREFHLILPAFQPPLYMEPPHRILQTSSLSPALAQLIITLRRARRTRSDTILRCSRTPTQLSNMQLPPSDTLDSDSPTDTLGLQSDTSTKQDRHHIRSKQTQTILRPSIGTASWPGGSVVGERAWWLDVASPTWEDMRAIGTVNFKDFHALLKCLIRTRHS